MPYRSVTWNNWVSLTIPIRDLHYLGTLEFGADRFPLSDMNSEMTAEEFDVKKV